MTKITAKHLAKGQKKISISEFFEKNKHILGFNTKTRALITAVKEGVDNSLDACEEARILPEVEVKIDEVDPDADEYSVTISDNGPGVVKKQIPKVFGKLLYGSRFHVIRQSRGQQGIGVSAVVLYAQLTTGKAAVIRSKTGEEEPAYRIKLAIDTGKNRPRVMSEKVILMDRPHGTSFKIHLKGRYVRNRKQSIFEYMYSTAIINPHASLKLIEPDGTVTVFDRVTEELPEMTEEIKPHPKGIEIGTFMKMAKETKCYKLTSFLVNEFSRVSYSTARKICSKADVPETSSPSRLTLEKVNKLLAAIEKVNIMAPPTDCLSPIGSELMKKGLRKEVDAKFVFTVTRNPTVFSGVPFQVEGGLVYGGDLPRDSRIEILRFANRVPLLYQQGNCVITKAIKKIDWRRYKLEQRGGRGIPIGPAMMLVHIASTNIPFTSEAKVAIAKIDAIKKEVELALRQCARQMRTNIKRTKKLKKAKEKFSEIQLVLPEIAEKAAKIVERPVPSVEAVLTGIMGVITIEEQISHRKRAESDGSDWAAGSLIQVTNYTEKERDITIYAKLPGGQAANIEPEPRRVKGELVEWRLKGISPSETRKIAFDVLGIEKGAYKPGNLLYSGVSGQVIGAKKLHR